MRVCVTSQANCISENCSGCCPLLGSSPCLSVHWHMYEFKYINPNVICFLTEYIFSDSYRMLLHVIRPLC